MNPTPESRSVNVFEFVDEFFAARDIMLAGSQSCVNSRSFRSGKSEEMRLSIDGLQFPLEAASLFAAHSAALGIAYMRRDKSTLDENMSSLEYLKALGDVSEWDLDRYEEVVAEIISLNVWRACLHMASCIRSIPEMNESYSLLLGLRPTFKRNEDKARVADAAKFMLDYLQQRLMLQ